MNRFGGKNIYEEFQVFLNELATPIVFQGKFRSVEPMSDQSGQIVVHEGTIDQLADIQRFFTIQGKRSLGKIQYDQREFHEALGEHWTRRTRMLFYTYEWTRDGKICRALKGFEPLIDADGSQQELELVA